MIVLGVWWRAKRGGRAEVRPWLGSSGRAGRSGFVARGPRLDRVLDPDLREMRGHRGASARSALDLEGAARDQRPLTHHDRPEMTLRRPERGVEPGAVVPDGQVDAVPGLQQGDPDMGGFAVLHGVHDRLARDLVD